MMAHKQLLHELLKEDQEPFQLKNYIADKRSQLNNSSPITTLQRKHIPAETSTKRTNACFFSFHNSPDVTKSPIFYFQSPAIRSPGGAAFLHVPSKTAAVLVEAAMRIRKQRKNQIKNVGFSLFGSIFRILKHRSNNKGLRNYEKGKLQEDIRISCSCSSDWIEEFDEINGGFAFREAPFCSSPFRFSLHRSPSSSARLTPEFCSPETSPSKQEKEKYATGEEEENEQCSPVSVLDPFIEDNGHENVDTEEDDYDLNCSIANIERAREKLLNRLRRFEELAELDPMELEQKFLECSDDEFQGESIESEDDEGPDTSTIQCNPRKMSAKMKRLVSDLIPMEKIDGWKHFPEEVEAAVEEVEGAILGVLVEELSDELFDREEEHQEHNIR